MHFCGLKSGRDVGVAETGTGHPDFLNALELINFIQDQNARGITICVLAIRVLP